MFQVLQALEKTTVVQFVPLKEHSAADSHTGTHGGPHIGVGGRALKEAAACGALTQDQATGRNSSLWLGAHTWTAFLSGIRGDSVSDPHCSKGKA